MSLNHADLWQSLSDSSSLWGGTTNLRLTSVLQRCRSALAISEQAPPVQAVLHQQHFRHACTCSRGVTCLAG